MALFGKKPEPVDAAPVFVPSPGDRFEGTAVFSEGFYYPVVNDEHSQEVGPNRDQPLVWVKDEEEPRGGYLVHAAAEDPNHFHRYGLNPVEVAPGDEE